MTREDITRMAREAGFVTLSINEELWVPYLERFAALVRADEREACAKVAEAWPFATPEQIAAAIRARGQR